MARSPLTDKHYAFADEYQETFKGAIEHVISTPPIDIFDEYLCAWAIALGVLAWDNFTGMLALLKAGKLRSAYMLARSLIDYHCRLRYYIEQAKEPRAKFAKDGNQKNHLRQMDAYVDWKNAQDKAFSILKDRPLELERFTEDEGEAFLTELQREHEVYQRNSQHMMKLAEPDDEMYRWMYTTFLWQSGYMHGDQITLWEIIENKEGVMNIYWDSESVSPIHTLADAVLYLLRMLESIEMLKGWAYGLHRLWRLSAIVFKEQIEDTPRRLPESV